MEAEDGFRIILGGDLIGTGIPKNHQNCVIIRIPISNFSKSSVFKILFNKLIVV